MVNISYHEFDSFGSRKRRTRFAKMDLNNPTKPVFVPFFEANQLDPNASIISIIESQDRVYLKAKIDTQPTQHLHEHRQEQEKDVHSALGLQDGHTGQLLDLGMEPLRRVVYEMRRLAHDTTQTSVDPFAARAAGIAPYTDYLLDHVTKLKAKERQEREINKLKAQINFAKDK